MIGPCVFGSQKEGKTDGHKFVGFWFFGGMARSIKSDPQAARHERKVEQELGIRT
jgi:hypothetical protein